MRDQYNRYQSSKKKRNRKIQELIRLGISTRKRRYRRAHVLGVSL